MEIEIRRQISLVARAHDRNRRADFASDRSPGSLDLRSAAQQASDVFVEVSQRFGWQARNVGLVLDAKDQDLRDLYRKSRNVTIAIFVMLLLAAVIACWLGYQRGLNDARRLESRGEITMRRID